MTRRHWTTATDARVRRECRDEGHARYPVRCDAVTPCPRCDARGRGEAGVPGGCGDMPPPPPKPDP